jgi:hypothetical protein
MSLINNRLIFISDSQNRFRINIQFAIRKFLKLVINLKKILDLLSLSNNNSLFELVNFHISKELYSLWYFLDKIFSFKYNLTLFSVYFQTNLTRMDFVFEDWIEKIKLITILYETINKLSYNYYSKQLELILLKNEKNIIVRFINFKIIIIMNKWIFKKLNIFPNWFFIRYYSDAKYIFLLENFKIKKKKIPYFLNLINAKKILIIGLWNRQFFQNFSLKQNYIYDKLKLVCLEDLIEYLGINICYYILKEIKSIFFLHYIDKIYNCCNIQRFILFNLKIVKNKSTFIYNQLFKISFSYVNKKIHKNLAIKINVKFLQIYEKISIILIHIKQLDYTFSNIIFIRLKKQHIFEKKNLICFFLIRMKFLSFIRIIKKIFLNCIFKTEIKFYIKLVQKSKIPIIFLNECRFFLKKLYKIFFLDNSTKLIFFMFIKIFSSIYFLKYSIKLTQNKKNNEFKNNFITSPFLTISEINWFLKYKISQSKKLFHKKIRVFISFIYIHQSFKKLISNFTLNFFYFKKYFI